MQHICVSVVFLIAIYAVSNCFAATSAQVSPPFYNTNTNAYGGGTSSSFSASSSATSLNSNSNSFASSTTNKDKNKRPSNAANDATEKGVLERFNHRYPDGSYEYRYELADGTARYERGYFLLIDRVKSLVVVGYYSYRMPDGRYITVFYNADQHGYRQNQSITPQTYPNLPRSIEVPEFKDETSYTPAVTTQSSSRIPITTTTRRNYY